MSGGSPLVRPMTEKDLDAAAALEAENFSAPWSRSAFAEELDKDNTVFLAAEADGILAGYCGAILVPDEGDITNVCVRESFRRRGIGDLLLRELLRRASGHGVRRLFLEVRESSLPARRLYEKNGFVPVGIRKGYYQGPVENAVIMCREEEE